MSRSRSSSVRCKIAMHTVRTMCRRMSSWKRSGMDTKMHVQRPARYASVLCQDVRGCVRLCDDVPGWARMHGDVRECAGRCEGLLEGARMGDGAPGCERARVNNTHLRCQPPDSCYLS